MKQKSARYTHNASKLSKIILSTIIIALTFALIFSLIVISKLNKNNLFSKSIITNNNYFLGYQTLSGENDSSSNDNKNLEQNPGDIEGIIEKLRIFLYDAYGIDYETYSHEYYSDITPFTFEKDASSSEERHPADSADYFSADNDSGEIISAKSLEEIIFRATDIFYTLGICNEAELEVSRMINKTLGIDLIKSEFFTESDKIIDVPYISQEGILPNGCEAVAATMLLRYYDFDISPEDFVDNFLSCEPVTIKWGCRYGPNPKISYAGDPRSETNGLGCFAPVIVKALNKYLPSGYYAKNITGTSLNTLKSEYIARGIPVAVWVTIGMDDIDRIIQWQSNDKTESFLYPANEHCMVFAGYDSENYYFYDPYKTNGLTKYSIDKSVLAYNSLGMQAVIILKKQ